MKRTVQIELAAIVAVVLALVGISRVRINSGAPALEVLNEAATGVDMVEPGEAFGPQPAEGNPVPGASPTSRTLGGTKGSSTDPGPEENLPAGTSSRDSETAGPPEHYTDQADDAYGADAPPNPTLSDPAIDIVRVDWGPVPYMSEEQPGGYFTSITVAGSARTDGSYVSYGTFSIVPGEECQLYHSLIPGTTAFASAICGYVELGTRREVGHMEGGPVSVTRTASGGTVLSATFERGYRTLRRLSAFTCISKQRRQDCNSYYDTGDGATSTLTYRV